MSYLANEVELIMHDLILYLRHKHRDDILLYFTKEAKVEVKEDSWDKLTNRVVHTIDISLEEELEDWLTRQLIIC